MFTVSFVLQALHILVAQTTLDTLEAAAEGFEVPPAIVIAVCTQESTLGTNPRARRICGCGARRGVGTSIEEQAVCAAQALSAAYTDCRTWDRALLRYRTGRCDGTPSESPDVPARYDRVVLRIAQRLHWQPARRHR